MLHFPAESLPSKESSIALHSFPFPFIEHRPQGNPKNEACILLHGLGETRCGIHYLHRDLAARLASNGYTVFRFDLAGCGDSVAPLSIEHWKSQVQKLTQSLFYYEKIHFISRGLSSILLPSSAKGKTLAINPPDPDMIFPLLNEIPLEQSSTHWIPKPLPDHQDFWISLGVELTCLGGFAAPLLFIEELKQNLTPWKGLKIETHSLFTKQAERNELISDICEILQ